MDEVEGFLTGGDGDGSGDPIASGSQKPRAPKRKSGNSLETPAPKKIKSADDCNPISSSEFVAQIMDTVKAEMELAEDASKRVDQWIKNRLAHLNDGAESPFPEPPCPSGSSHGQTHPDSTILCSDRLSEHTRSAMLAFLFAARKRKVSEGGDPPLALPKRSQKHQQQQQPPQPSVRPTRRSNLIKNMRAYSPHFAWMHPCPSGAECMFVLACKMSGHPLLFSSREAYVGMGFLFEDEWPAEFAGAKSPPERPCVLCLLHFVASSRSSASFTAAMREGTGRQRGFTPVNPFRVHVNAVGEFRRESIMAESVILAGGFPMLNFQDMHPAVCSSAPTPEHPHGIPDYRLLGSTVDGICGEGSAPSLLEKDAKGNLPSPALFPGNQWSPFQGRGKCEGVSTFQSPSAYVNEMPSVLDPHLLLRLEFAQMMMPGAHPAYGEHLSRLSWTMLSFEGVIGELRRLLGEFGALCGSGGYRSCLDKMFFDNPILESCVNRFPMAALVFPGADPHECWRTFSGGTCITPLEALPYPADLRELCAQAFADGSTAPLQNIALVREATYRHHPPSSLFGDHLYYWAMLIRCNIFLHMSFRIQFLGVEPLDRLLNQVEIHVPLLNWYRRHYAHTGLVATDAEAEHHLTPLMYPLCHPDVNQETPHILPPGVLLGHLKSDVLSHPYVLLHEKCVLGPWHRAPEMLAEYARGASLGDIADAEALRSAMCSIHALAKEIEESRKCAGGGAAPLKRIFSAWCGTLLGKRAEGEEAANAFWHTQSPAILACVVKAGASFEIVRGFRKTFLASPGDAGAPFMEEVGPLPKMGNNLLERLRLRMLNIGSMITDEIRAIPFLSALGTSHSGSRSSSNGDRACQMNLLSQAVYHSQVGFELMQRLLEVGDTFSSLASAPAAGDPDPPRQEFSHQEKLRMFSLHHNPFAVHHQNNLPEGFAEIEFCISPLPLPDPMLWRPSKSFISYLVGSLLGAHFCRGNGLLRFSGAHMGLAPMVDQTQGKGMWSSDCWMQTADTVAMAIDCTKCFMAGGYTELADVPLEGPVLLEISGALLHDTKEFCEWMHIHPQMVQVALHLYLRMHMNSRPHLWEHMDRLCAGFRRFSDTVLQMAKVSIGLMVMRRGSQSEWETLACKFQCMWEAWQESGMQLHDALNKPRDKQKGRGRSCKRPQHLGYFSPMLRAEEVSMASSWDAAEFWVTTQLDTPSMRTLLEVRKTEMGFIRRSLRDLKLLSKFMRTRKHRASKKKEAAHGGNHNNGDDDDDNNNNNDNDNNDADGGNGNEDDNSTDSDDEQVDHPTAEEEEEEEFIAGSKHNEKRDLYLAMEIFGGDSIVDSIALPLIGISPSIIQSLKLYRKAFFEGKSSPHFQRKILGSSITQEDIPVLVHIMERVAWTKGKIITINREASPVRPSFPSARENAEDCGEAWDVCMPSACAPSTRKIYNMVREELAGIINVPIVALKCPWEGGGGDGGGAAPIGSRLRDFVSPTADLLLCGGPGIYPGQIMGYRYVLPGTVGHRSKGYSSSSGRCHPHWESESHPSPASTSHNPIIHEESALQNVEAHINAVNQSVTSSIWDLPVIEEHDLRSEGHLRFTTLMPYASRGKKGKFGPQQQAAALPAPSPSNHCGGSGTGPEQEEENDRSAEWWENWHAVYMNSTNSPVTIKDKKGKSPATSAQEPLLIQRCHSQVWNFRDDGHVLPNISRGPPRFPVPRKSEFRQFYSTTVYQSWQRVLKKNMAFQTPRKAFEGSKEKKKPLGAFMRDTKRKISTMPPKADTLSSMALCSLCCTPIQYSPATLGPWNGAYCGSCPNPWGFVSESCVQCISCPRMVECPHPIFTSASVELGPIGISAPGSPSGKGHGARPAATAAAHGFFERSIYPTGKGDAEAMEAIRIYEKDKLGSKSRPRIMSSMTRVSSIRLSPDNADYICRVVNEKEGSLQMVALCEGCGRFSKKAELASASRYLTLMQMEEGIPNPNIGKMLLDFLQEEEIEIEGAEPRL